MVKAQNLAVVSGSYCTKISRNSDSESILTAVLLLLLMRLYRTFDLKVYVGLYNIEEHNVTKSTTCVKYELCDTLHF